MNPPQGVHAIFVNGKRYVREDSIGIPVVLGPGPDDAAIARIVPAAAAGEAMPGPFQPSVSYVPEDSTPLVSRGPFKPSVSFVPEDQTPLVTREDVMRIYGEDAGRDLDQRVDELKREIEDAIDGEYVELEDRAEEQPRPDCRQEDPDACPFGESCTKDWWHHSKSLDWVRSLLANAGVLELVHCDDLVLHEPGECTYCDEHGKRAQRRRIDFGIPFSGQRGAPDALFRPDEVIRQWSGNVPVKKGELHSHLGATFVVE